MTPLPTRFTPGYLLITPGAQQALGAAGERWIHYLSRHLRGDWGDLDEHDREANERALRTGSRLLSAYHLKDGTKVWIITEADRSTTTLLLPSEY